ncbi:MAG: hypothetical protein LUQ22_02985 [Methanotrichaceae archaeon]|nr:hypothetical protein [Methanotrichaceae archaeon]
MIWSKRLLVGRVWLMIWLIQVLELETAKEILSELFDIRTHDVDEMVRQRMEEGTL